MSEVAFETGKKIIAASHEWAARLDAGYSSEERERMRVGYANGALAIAAERDRLRESNAELLAALRGLELLHSRPNEGPNERFERIGEAFQRDTGYLRPGKDEAPATGGTRDGEREAAWEAWVEAARERARTAIAKAEKG